MPSVIKEVDGARPVAGMLGLEEIEHTAGTFSTCHVFAEERYRLLGGQVSVVDVVEDLASGDSATSVVGSAHWGPSRPCRCHGPSPHGRRAVAAELISTPNGFASRSPFA